MKTPDYCPYEHGDCSTCSLVNYGRDCQNNPVPKDPELPKKIGPKRDETGQNDAKNVPPSVGRWAKLGGRQG